MKFTTQESKMENGFTFPKGCRVFVSFLSFPRLGSVHALPSPFVPPYPSPPSADDRAWLQFSPYAMGRNPRRYPNPEVVRPERWIPFVEPSPFEFPVFQVISLLCACACGRGARCREGGGFILFMFLAHALWWHF